MLNGGRMLLLCLHSRCYIVIIRLAKNWSNRKLSWLLRRSFVKKFSRTGKRAWCQLSVRIHHYQQQWTLSYLYVTVNRLNSLIAEMKISKIVISFAIIGESAHKIPVHSMLIKTSICRFQWIYRITQEMVIRIESCNYSWPFFFFWMWFDFSTPFFVTGICNSTNAQTSIEDGSSVEIPGLGKILDIDTSSMINEVEKWIEEKCEMNGGSAKNVPKHFLDCIRSLKTDEKTFPQEINVDEAVAKKYCDVVPGLERCMQSITVAIEPCLIEPEDKETVDILLNVTTLLPKFICMNEGDDIASKYEELIIARFINRTKRFIESTKSIFDNGYCLLRSYITSNVPVHNKK